MNPPGGIPAAAQAGGGAPAPIHDVEDIVSFFPYPLWVVVVISLLSLAVLGLFVWFLFFRKRASRPLGARERAIAALVRLQSEMLSPYGFGVKVSDILRSYIDEAFGIRAVTATSLEFLETIKGHSRFSEEEKLSLKDFLETADLIKYARADADGEDLSRLFSAAEAVIRKQEEPAKDKKSKKERGAA